MFQTVSAGTTSAADLQSITISTTKADREGDSVIPEGGDFSNFMKAPVLMWAHGGHDGYSSVPIGSVASLDVIPGQGIKAEFSFLKGDPFADRIKNAWEQGVVRASSIGFAPREVEYNGVGHDIMKWELLELSLCAIPMNPEAVRSLKALGLDPVIIEDAVEVAVPIDAKPLAPAAPEPLVGPDPGDENDAVMLALEDLRAQVLALTARMPITETPLTEDDPTFTLIEDEPTFTVNAGEVRAAIVAALKATIVDPAVVAMDSEIRRAKGRVY